MSRTIRQSKRGKCRDGKKNNEILMRHDLTPIRKGMNQSFRAEEKDYFEKTGETKYKNKPKSRGGTW